PKLRIRKERRRSQRDGNGPARNDVLTNDDGRRNGRRYVQYAAEPAPGHRPEHADAGVDGRNGRPERLRRRHGRAARSEGRNTPGPGLWPGRKKRGRDCSEEATVGESCDRRLMKRIGLYISCAVLAFLMLFVWAIGTSAQSGFLTTTITPGNHPGAIAVDP